LTLAAGPTVQFGGVLNQNTSVTFGGASNFALSFGDNVGPGPTANVKLGNTAGISATQTANAQFGGSVSSPIRVVTANYTLANDDYTLLCNNTANVAPVIITPPAAAASNMGRVYIVKRVNPDQIGTNDDCAVANLEGVVGNVVLSAPGTLTTQRSGVTIQSDGTQWWIVGVTAGTVPPSAVQGVATTSFTMNEDVYTRFPLEGGPSVQAVVPASGQLILILTAEANTSKDNETAFMSVSLNGSVALDANSLRVTGGNPVRASITVLITNLTPGVTINFAAGTSFAAAAGRRHRDVQCETNHRDPELPLPPRCAWPADCASAT
jgi:hypothetical protein